MAAKLTMSFYVLFFLVVAGHWYLMMFLGVDTPLALGVWSLILSGLWFGSLFWTKEIKRTWQEVIDD